MQHDPPQTIDDVMAENARLKAVQPVGRNATLYVISTVFLAISTVASIIVITIIRPDHDNTSIIATIVGVVTPILVGLLAAAIQQVHLAVNSRLSQLLELTAAESKARGALNERNRGDATAVALLAKGQAREDNQQSAVAVPVTIVSPDPLPVKQVE